ncbi:MAG: ribonuclease III domain-containing protein [Eubacteriales bacterium]|nr:ribonuclease III domain-containing protein [Eubacteriales bacterium]
MIVSESDLAAMSALALAHVGDAVYELLVRTELCRAGRLTAGQLHRETVRYVAAPAQAKAALKLLPRLTEQEAAVYRRGRNAHGHAAPKAASPQEYHAASGLEALFGWLYLRGDNERARELFNAVWEDD